MIPSPLQRENLPGNPVTLGRWLLGRDVVRVLEGKAMSGRIVETEVYLPDDPASHSFIGLRPRNKSMFLERGHAYVYRIYGMWNCLNVSAGPRDTGAAVLIRALEPLVGLDRMRDRRRNVPDRELARGPGRLCEALAIDLSFDGIDLCWDENLFLSEGLPYRQAPACSRRIGITKAADQMLRFSVPHSRFVSGPLTPAA